MKEKATVDLELHDLSIKERWQITFGIWVFNKVVFRFSVADILKKLKKITLPSSPDKLKR